jgi:hypothetical protein
LPYLYGLASVNASFTEKFSREFKNKPFEYYLQIGKLAS